MSHRTARALGIALGYGLDRLVGDPRRGHPVAGFGRAAAALEAFTYRDSRTAGAAHTALLIAPVTAAGWAVDHAARRSAVATVGVTALAVWMALGGTTLVRVGTQMSDRLRRGEIDQARALLPSLCGREPDALDAAALTRAAVESVAENTSDAQVAPLLWAALGGVPGVFAYRAANTLDAMIGHRSPRYRHFGWAAARLDDLLNLLPARLTAAVTAVVAPLLGGSAVATLRVCWRDARRHPSPNAGVAETAFAGALGVRLGGLTRYSYGEQTRPVLGRGIEPRLGDLQEAVRLSRTVQAGALLVACAAALTGVRIGRRGAPR